MRIDAVPDRLSIIGVSTTKSPRSSPHLSLPGLAVTVIVRGKSGAAARQDAEVAEHFPQRPPTVGCPSSTTC